MHRASRTLRRDDGTLAPALQGLPPRRALLGALLIAAPLLAGAPAGAQTAEQQARSERWIATWTAPQVARLDQPPQSLPASAQAYPWVRDVPQAVKDANARRRIAGRRRVAATDQGADLRQIAHVSLGGPRVRVVLSNSLGTLPLRVGAAHVALRDKGPSIVAASDHVLTFGGLASPTVPPGALLVSDPVDLTVPDSGDLVVDLLPAGRHLRLEVARQLSSGLLAGELSFRSPVTMPAPPRSRSRARRPTGAAMVCRPPPRSSSAASRLSDPTRPACWSHSGTRSRTARSPASIRTSAGRICWRRVSPRPARAWPS